MIRQPARTAALVVGLAVTAFAAGPPGGADAAEVRRVAERTFEFDAGGRVRIDNENGRVTVEGWDHPQVRVQITRIVRAPDAEKARSYLRELRAEIEVRGDQLEIVSRFPKRRESIGFWELVGQRVAAAQIHYYVQVPRVTRLGLKTTNGSVRVRGLAGDAAVSTTNGSLTVRDVRGRVTASTTNGSVELQGIDGGARAWTTNGSVRASVRGLRGEAGVELTTTNGNVEAYLPERIRATLRATTTNGKVHVSYPLTVQGTLTSKTVRGTIGGGGRPITLMTTNGNIHVRRLSERRAERGLEETP